MPACKSIRQAVSVRKRSAYWYRTRLKNHGGIMTQRSCSSGLGKSRSILPQSNPLLARPAKKLSWRSLGLVASYQIESLEHRIFLSAAQAYTFQNVNIGAGGFVHGIFYSATQQNVIYARTDIGGLYKTTNDGATWSELLDFVGNNTTTSGNGTQQQLIGVLSFAIDPENPNNLFADVGEYTGTDGAVFYSTNAGATWSQTNLPFSVGGNSNGRGDGEQIAVDPKNSNIGFPGPDPTSGTAGTADGLWESTNSGHSFSQMTSFPTVPGS